MKLLVVVVVDLLLVVVVVVQGDSVRQLWWLPRSLSLAAVNSMTTAAASMARDVGSTMLVKLKTDTLPLLDTLYLSPMSHSQQQLKKMLLRQLWRILQKCCQGCFQVWHPVLVLVWRLWLMCYLPLCRGE
jgi:hypothetical protein